MSSLDILRKARAKIERGWTQSVYARDAGGDSVDFEDPSAVCFCAEGAVYASASILRDGVDAVRYMQRWMDLPNILDWNDNPDRTQQDVLRLFDQVIADLEKKAEGKSDG